LGHEDVIANLNDEGLLPNPGLRTEDGIAKTHGIGLFDADDRATELALEPVKEGPRVWRGDERDLAKAGGKQLIDLKSGHVSRAPISGRDVLKGQVSMCRTCHGNDSLLDLQVCLRSADGTGAHGDSQP
jgi:hypothetical protein